MSIYNHKNPLSKIYKKYGMTTSTEEDDATYSNPYDNGTMWSQAPVKQEEEEEKGSMYSFNRGSAYEKIKNMMNKKEVKEDEIVDELSAPRNQMDYYSGQLNKLGVDVPEPEKTTSFGSKALDKTFDIIGVLGTPANAIAGGVKEVVDKIEGNDGKEWKTDDSPLGILKDVWDILGKGTLGSGLSTLSAPILGDKVRGNIVDTGMALDTMRNAKNTTTGEVLGAVVSGVDEGLGKLNPVSQILKMTGQFDKADKVNEFVTNFGADVLLSSKFDIQDMGKGLKYLNNTDEIKKIASAVDKAGDSNVDEAFKAFKDVKRSGVEKEVKLAYKGTKDVTEEMIVNATEAKLAKMRNSDEFKALFSRTDKALGGLGDFEGVKMGKKVILSPEQLEKLGSKTSTKVASNVAGTYLNPFAQAYSLGKGSTRKLLGKDNLVAKAFTGGANQPLYKALDNSFNNDDVYSMFKNVQLMQETRYARNVKQFRNGLTMSEIDNLAEEIKNAGIDANDIADIIETNGDKLDITKEVIDNAPNSKYAKEVMQKMGIDIDEVKRNSYGKIKDTVDKMDNAIPEIQKGNMHSPVEYFQDENGQTSFLNNVLNNNAIEDTPLNNVLNQTDKSQMSFLDKNGRLKSVGNDISMKPTPIESPLEAIKRQNLSADKDYYKKADLQKQVKQMIKDSDIVNKEEYLNKVDYSNSSVEDLYDEIKFWENKKGFKEKSYNRGVIQRNTVVDRIKGTGGTSVYDNIESSAQNSIDDLLNMRRLVTTKGNKQRFFDAYGLNMPTKGEYSISEKEARNVFNKFIESNKDTMSPDNLKRTMKKEKQIIESLRYFGKTENGSAYTYVKDLVSHTSNRYGKPLDVVEKFDDIGLETPKSKFKNLNDLDTKGYNDSIVKDESLTGYAKSVENEIKSSPDVKEYNKNLTEAGGVYDKKNSLEYMGSNEEDVIANRTLPKRDNTLYKSSQKRIKEVTPNIDSILKNSDDVEVRKRVKSIDLAIQKLSRINRYDEEFVKTLGLGDAKTLKDVDDIVRKISGKFNVLSKDSAIDKTSLMEYLGENLDKDNNKKYFDMIKNNSVVNEENGLNEISKIFDMPTEKVKKYFNKTDDFVDELAGRHKPDKNPLERVIKGSDVDSKTSSKFSDIVAPVISKQAVVETMDTTVKLVDDIHTNPEIRNNLSTKQLDIIHKRVKELGKGKLTEKFSTKNVERDVHALLNEKYAVEQASDRIQSILNTTDSVTDKKLYDSLKSQLDGHKEDLKSLDEAIEGFKDTKGIARRQKTLELLNKKLEVYEGRANGLEFVGLDINNLAKNEIDFETASDWFVGRGFTSQHPKYDTVKKLVNDTTTIDTMAGLSDDVKKITNEIVDTFKELGIKEDILKLESYGEFTGYVTHALSDTTKDNMGEIEKVLRHYNFDLTKPFNINGLSRDLQGTIKSINKLMKNEYHIDNFFESNILKLVSDRVLHSNKMEYSNTIKELYESSSVTVDMLNFKNAELSDLQSLLKKIGGTETTPTLKYGIGEDKQLVSPLEKALNKNNPNKIGAKINMYNPETGGRQTIPYDAKATVHLSHDEKKTAIINDIYKRISEIKTGTDKNFVIVRHDLEETDKPIRRLKDSILQKFQSTIDSNDEDVIFDAYEKQQAEMAELIDGTKNNIKQSGFVNAGIDDTVEDIMKKIETNEYIIMDRGVAEQYDKICNDSMGKELTKFNKIYDKAMTFFKAWAVTSPSFHVNNIIGNFFNGVLNTGMSIFSPKIGKEAKSILKEINGCVDGDFSKLTGEIHGIPKKDFAEALVKDGMLSGFFNIDMESITNKIQSSIDGVENESNVLKKFAGKVNPFDTGNNIVTKASQKLGESIEINSKIRNVLSHMEQGKNVYEAMDLTNAALFDYGDLTDFESNVVKRYVSPFYTFAAKNVPYQVETLANKTGKYYPLKKLYDYTNDDMSEKEKNSRPDYVKGGIRIGEGKYLNMDTPLSSMANLGSINGVLGTLNPFVKAPLDYAYNTSSYNGSEISKTNNPLEKLAFGVKSVAPVLGTAEKFYKGFTGSDADKKTLMRWITANRTKEYDSVSAEKTAMYNYVDKLQDKYYDTLKKNPALKDYLEQIKQEEKDKKKEKKSKIMR